VTITCNHGIYFLHLKVHTYVNVMHKQVYTKRLCSQTWLLTEEYMTHMCTTLIKAVGRARYVNGRCRIWFLSVTCYVNWTLAVLVFINLLLSVTLSEICYLHCCINVSPCYLQQHDMPLAQANGEKPLISFVHRNVICSVFN